MNFKRKVILPETKIELKNDSKSDLDALIEMHNFKQLKYLELVRDFLDKHCRFELMYMTSHSELKKVYNDYLRESDTPNKALNIAYTISPIDISRIDSRFKYKRVYVCKSCDKRWFSGCCSQYHKNNRKSVYYMINLRLIA